MDLEAIKARCEAATKGLWSVQLTRPYNENTGISCDGGINLGRMDTENNAEFCAHAREDIPALVAEVERLERQLTVATQEIEELREDFVDFACSGVNNLAPYCKNQTKGCVDGRGWCNNKSGECKGFTPKAWCGPQEGDAENA